MARLALLLRQLDQAYDRKSWHGPNLRGSLRGVSAAAAVWKPAPDRHSIWELATHCAYWKYVVLRKITGAPKGSFSIEGSNWFTSEAEPSESAWKGDLKLLAETHRALRAAVAGLSEKQLDDTPAGGKTTLIDLLVGVAAHDIYHAGQIQLLKRLRVPS